MKKKLFDYKKYFLWEIILATQRGFWDQNCPGTEWKVDLYLCACFDKFLEPVSDVILSIANWVQALQQSRGTPAVASMSMGQGRLYSMLCIFHLGL